MPENDLYPKTGLVQFWIGRDDLMGLDEEEGSKVIYYPELDRMATENKPRINFASVQNPYPYPDFLDLQLKSFKDFLQLDTPPENRKEDGLYKVFVENFPITDTRNNFVLEFLDYYIDPPRYSIAECLERGLTYSVPLKAKMKLYCTDPEHEDFGTFIQDVFLGTIPYMTDNGTFYH